jgi:hypothetical protein
VEPLHFPRPLPREAAAPVQPFRLAVFGAFLLATLSGAIVVQARHSPSDGRAAEVHLHR